jgi:DNA-binding SARP family transcriptional activator/TolB-like protein
VGANGVGSVETSVELFPPAESRGCSALVDVRMLGPLTIRRHEAVLPLPASRKVRALLAYLALAPHAVARARLCELLWDVPNDPRGELRWCLSKIRKLVDEPERRRVDTRADTVTLDLSDCFVDAIEVVRAAEDIAATAPDRLRTLEALSGREFLEGLELGGSPYFNGWLAAQRRRFRGFRAALLEQLIKRVSDDESLPYLEKWLELAPFELCVHKMMFNAFARRSKILEAQDHLASTILLFEAEGVDSAPVRDAWRAAFVRLEDSSRAAVAGPLITPASVRAGEGDDAIVTVPARRASVAVMPFADCSALVDDRGGVAGALAHDVITRLAKLRSLFVIAQGTMFALHERNVAAEEAGRLLGVDYVVNGSVSRQGSNLKVTVEVSDTRTARIVWAEIFKQQFDDAFLVLDEIGDKIVASVAAEIETSERNRAILRPPNSLDAWEAHHRGLWHVYRFNKDDNERARHYFAMAVQLDPTFARAYAGLSFSHFQNAFQGWAQREPEVARAYEAARESLIVDDRDPAAHLAIGRALWLRGRHEQSIVELEQAVDLSPNFALAHYTLAFVHAQTGNPHAAVAFSDHSRELSPFDPLLFGMLGARAMALVRMGDFEEAAVWAVKAAARPNAHAHIQAIAAFSLALAGRLDESRTYLASIRAALPSYGVQDFLNAMQFRPDGERFFRQAAKLLRLN